MKIFVVYFFSLLKCVIGKVQCLREKTREDKGDREGIPRTPYSIGNSSPVIFNTTDPKGD